MPSLKTADFSFVIDDLKTNLLGLPAIKALDLVSRVEATIDSKSLIIDKFPSVFQGLGNLGEEYETRLSQEQHLTLSSPLDMCHYHFDLRWWWCQRKKLSAFV